VSTKALGDATAQMTMITMTDVALEMIRETLDILGPGAIHTRIRDMPTLAQVSAEAQLEMEEVDRVLGQRMGRRTSALLKERDLPRTQRVV
jgi:hypothetical protein